MITKQMMNKALPKRRIAKENCRHRIPLMRVMFPHTNVVSCVPLSPLRAKVLTLSITLIHTKHTHSLSFERDEFLLCFNIDNINSKCYFFQLNSGLFGVGNTNPTPIVERGGSTSMLSLSNHIRSFRYQ
jgi:hypothetical protein